MRIRRGLSFCLALGLAFGAVACGGQSGDDPAPAGEETTGEDGGGEEIVPTEPADESSGSQVPSDTFVNVTIGEPQSLDPAWTYETSGAGIESNIYEGLVYFDRESATDFVPALAESWEASEDDTIYTFDIRDGVSFHAGGTLEPSDIAYSLQRAMLQDRVDGPMWLFLEPILGTSSITSLALETAGLGDSEDATLEDVPDDVALAVCELVQTAVQADNEAATVTIAVQQPTPWLLQLLSQPWGAALDMEWMVEQGDWDGDCATWRQWHSPAAEESVLFDQANGTGPYMLETWNKGVEIRLEANENYWRSEPVWDGGPSGVADLKYIVIQSVDEWGTRFAKLTAGEADTVNVPRAEINQVEDLIHTMYEGGDADAPATEMNPDGTLNLYVGYPTVSMTAAMFNFDVNPESTFIGSGALDGAGIPVDFFSDISVRRGFSYCFDWETFIADALQGEGVQARGPIIEGLQGFDPDSDIITTDLEMCESELAAAWDGAVAENGFQMTIAYNQGNTTRQTAAQILADNLALVNPAYQVDVIELEWPSFLEARQNEEFPVSVSGWLEDYHDASNWVHPYMHSAGAYARAQGFPDEMQARFDELVEQGLAETDEAAREEIYAELQRLANEEAISIWLYQATGRFYLNKDVSGWFNHPLAPGLWYYALSKN